jgi:hypothetical protein
MKKITLLIVLMITSLGFAQPTTSAPVPTKNASDVVSVYGGSYTSIATNLNPNWGQSGTVNASFNPGDGNLCMAYTNFNYQGTILTQTNLSAMEYLHVDVWTNKAPANFILQVTPVNVSAPGEVLVTINHVQGNWYSVDIPKSSFTGMTWNSVKELKFAANGAGSTPPGDIYLDNIYFWKTPPPAGTPVIGPLTVPAKQVGDAPFNLTAPTSDSPGTFSYTSSNLAVATILGSTVTVVGAGTSVITAIQAASPPYLTGSVTANLVVEAFPLTAAPTPPARPITDVKSIYSDAYTPIATLIYTGDVNTYNTSWCGGTTSQVSVVGNNTHKVTGLGCKGVDFQIARFDATGFTHCHIDIWTATPTLDKSVTLKFSNWNGGAGEFNAILYSVTNASTYKLPNPNPGTWISLDIPLADFFQGNANGVIRNDLVQFIISSDLGTVYYDNLYLHKNTTLGTNKFETSTVKMYPNPVKNTLTIEANSEIQRVSVYNVLGQEVMKASPKSNSATLQNESWKIRQEGEVGAGWGIWDKNENLKFNK